MGRGTARCAGIGLARREPARVRRVAVGEHHDLARHPVGRARRATRSRSTARRRRRCGLLRLGRSARKRASAARSSAADAPGSAIGQVDSLEGDHAELEPVVRHAVDQVLERARARPRARRSARSRHPSPSKRTGAFALDDASTQDHDLGAARARAGSSSRASISARSPSTTGHPQRAPAATPVTSGQRSSRPTPDSSGPYGRSAGHSRRIRSRERGAHRLRARAGAPARAAGRSRRVPPGRRDRGGQSDREQEGPHAPAQRTGPWQILKRRFPLRRARELSPTLTANSRAS